MNVSAITIGTRPTETRLIGTLKIDRVQLERVSLACNLKNMLTKINRFNIIFIKNDLEECNYERRREELWEERSWVGKTLCHLI